MLLAVGLLRNQRGIYLSVRNAIVRRLRKTMTSQVVE